MRHSAEVKKQVRSNRPTFALQPIIESPCTLATQPCKYSSLRRQRRLGRSTALSNRNLRRTLLQAASTTSPASSKGSTGYRLCPSDRSHAGSQRLHRHNYNRSNCCGTCSCRMHCCRAQSPREWRYWSSPNRRGRASPSPCRREVRWCACKRCFGASKRTNCSGARRCLRPPRNAR